MRSQDGLAANNAKMAFPPIQNGACCTEDVFSLMPLHALISVPLGLGFP